MSLEREVDALLAPGGRVASAWPRYEERGVQRTLTGEIAATLEHGGTLLAEAPTGVGKSLAYLLPALLYAERTNRRVVVATCTRSLQDQLYERDLPQLMDVIGVHVKVARLKGKQNYICPRALDLQDGTAPEERAVLERLRRWSVEDAEGDLDRFESEDPEALRRIRPRVSTDPAACSMTTCMKGRECFWVRARRRASEARLLIVNHALLALSGDVDGLLPDFDVVVVDEAHRLEGVLLGQLERSVTRNRIEELLKQIGSGRRGAAQGGLLARLSAFSLPLLHGGEGETIQDVAQRVTNRVGECRSDSDKLFKALEPDARPAGPYAYRGRYRSSVELMGPRLEPLETVIDHCSAIAGLLVRMGRRVEQGGGHGIELGAEADQLAARFSACGRDLADLAEATERDWVYWRTASTRSVGLHGSPISVGEHARRLVFDRARAAILTSATLSSGGDFDFIAGRLGLGEQWRVPYTTCSTPSPFSLARQMKSYVYDPQLEEAEAVSRVVASLARESEANQLVLFTAHERLRRARERLQAVLGPEHELLAQEWDGPAGILAERFRRSRGAILLGVQSLWEGVDFPGESLEILVVAKLPFSVPDEPMIEARGERLRDAGLDPFRHDALPEAVLRFRQGIGRLIRRADDRGVLVVCDPRLRTAGYRRAFLEVLPAAPELHRNEKSLAEDAARFLKPLAVEEH